MTHHAERNGQRGVSLIELMVALVIGALLLLGLVEVFSASRSAYQLSSGLARTQENGRFALDLLQRDIRLAGHMGCVNDQARFLPDSIAVRPGLVSTFQSAAEQANSDYSGLDERLLFNVGLSGHESNGTGPGSALAITTTPTPATAAGNWSPALSEEIFGDMNAPVLGSDVLVLRYFSPAGAQVTNFSPGEPTATIAFLSDEADKLTEGVQNPGLFGMSDCTNAVLFQASAPLDAAGGNLTVQSGSGRNVSGLITPFVGGQATLMLYRAESVVFYVGVNGQGNPALYRLRYQLTPGAATLTPVNEELVEGIESLQLQFAQDSNPDGSAMPTGNMGWSAIASGIEAGPASGNPEAWRRVGLVQVGLVARSTDPAAASQRAVSDQTPPLSALGVTVTPPGDTYYRTVYEDAIALRNRLFGN